MQVITETGHNSKTKIVAVLGTCATFSATAPLARTKKGGTRRGGAKIKNNGAVAVARKKVALIRAISTPLKNQI